MAISDFIKNRLLEIIRYSRAVWYRFLYTRTRTRRWSRVDDDATRKTIATHKYASDDEYSENASTSALLCVCVFFFSHTSHTAAIALREEGKKI